MITMARRPLTAEAKRSPCRTAVRSRRVSHITHTPTATDAAALKLKPGPIRTELSVRQPHPSCHATQFAATGRNPGAVQ